MTNKETTTNENVVPAIASVKSKTGMTEDKPKYNADGGLASLSTPNPPVLATNPTVSEIPVPVADTWDEVNKFRKALKENARGYLAVSASAVVGTCFLVSILAGTILAMPVVFIVSTYDHLHKFFTNRSRKKAATVKDNLVSVNTGPADSNLRVVRSSEVE